MKKSSKSGEKYAQIWHRLKVKTVQISEKNMSVDFNVRGQQEMDFSTGGSVIMDKLLILAKSNGFKVKMS